jgi:uncharacterized protein YceK
VNNLKPLLVLLYFSCLMAGCSSWMTVVTPTDGGGWAAGSLSCEHVINYQARRIEVEGIDIPMQVVGSSNMIKVAKIDIKPESLRQATQLIQSLDLFQYSSCTDALNAYGMGLNDLSEKLILQKQEGILTLSKVLGALQNSTSEEQHNKVVAEGSEKLSKLTAIAAPGQPKAEP